MQYAVYGLVDPRTWLIRYVGMTSVPLEKRVRGHVLDKRVTHRRWWVEQLLARELRPYIVLIEDGFATKQSAGAAETGAEAYAKAWTTRRANGRDKTQQSPEERARRSAIMKQYYADLHAGRRPYPGQRIMT